MIMWPLKNIDNMYHYMVKIYLSHSLIKIALLLDVFHMHAHISSVAPY